MIKKLILLLTASLFLSSCMTWKSYTFYQVCKATPVDASHITNTQTGMMYEDDNCAILYSFWAESGNAGFTILNKTDKVMFIDLMQTFFIRNGMTYDYYLPTAKPSDNSEKSFRPIVAIPPLGCREFLQQNISDCLYVDCDLNRFPTTFASISFDDADSPLHFANYLTYNFGEGTKDIVIDNQFFISSITNYAQPSLVKYQKGEEIPCLNKTDDYIKEYTPEYYAKQYNEVCTINTSDCFYLRYDKESSWKLYQEPQKHWFYGIRTEKGE